MQLIDLLTPDRVAVLAGSASKKRLLESLSELLARTMSGVDERLIFDGFFKRERLGSTGLGNGIAIPHCHLRGPDGPAAGCMLLRDGVSYDGSPVDLIFALVVPEDAPDDHVRLLGEIATLLADENTVRDLRNAESPEKLFKVLTESCANGGALQP